MHVRGGVLAATAVAATLIGVAGAGAASGGSGSLPGHAPRVHLEKLQTHALHVSTKASALRTLRSLGVSTRHVVVQRGTRNYAGPNCPGKGWTCTTSTRVLQLGPRPGTHAKSAATVNKVDCGTNGCLVVQSDAVNVAHVKQKSSGNQLAIVLQAGTSNTADVVQLLQQTDLFTFHGRQQGLVLQWAPNGGSNSFTGNQLVSQHANATSSGAITQSLEGDQSFHVVQAGLQGASNSASTIQNLVQQAVARTTGATSGITQNESTFDLDPSTPLTTSSVIDQFSDTGTNTASRQQRHDLGLTADAQTGDITQAQGSNDSGIDASSDGSIHQLSAGVSTSNVDQNESQTVSANTSPPGQVSQTQVGPLRCCSQQLGNGGNSFVVDQTSDLTASDANADQQDNVSTDASSSGTVQVQQTVTVNGETNNGSCSGSSCNTTTTGGGGPPATGTDFAAFGYGGMRGLGTGSIDVTGISGTVTQALLYWNGPTNSTDPAVNAAVMFEGTPVTGTNIGISGDNNWGFANSQSYRADVTSLVTGNGSYSLADFTKTDADVNGAALLVFYDDGNPANNRNITLWEGDDSTCGTTFDGDGWDQTINGVDYPGSGTALLHFVVGDGQPQFSDGEVDVNGQTLVPAGQIFDGASVPAGPSTTGSLWDVESFDMTSLLTAGTNTLHITSPLAGDCTSLVVVAADTPAQAPIG